MSSLKCHKRTYRGIAQRYPSNVIRDVICKLFTFSISLLTFLLLSFSISDSAELIGPEVTFQGNEILVTTSLALDNKYLEEINNGMTKEFRFHIDIFRVWKMWPDEFILGKSFVRTVTCDPVKKEYTATSNDGITLLKKRFRSFESMLGWSLDIRNLKLANLHELEPGVYFVRVTIASSIRKLPPVIGYFMIFTPENEFRLTRDSRMFSVGAAR